MSLGNAQPADVQVTGRQVAAAYDRARRLGAANPAPGADGSGRAGEQLALASGPFVPNRGTPQVGPGPNNVTFTFSDAVCAPLAARQDRRAQPVSANDPALAVAEVYFTIQQARGDLAGALAAEARAEEVARRTAELVKGLAAPAEGDRARAELVRRKQAVAAARERRRKADAELARLLRLDPTVAVEPAEPASLSVTVIDPAIGMDDLISVALNARPERAGAQSRDRIAEEVAARFTEVQSAARRLSDAEPALKDAVTRTQRNVEGLGQTRRVGDTLAIAIRPQDAVAALQAFAQANAEFYAAVADYNRAQFRLYGALGHPAQCLAAAPGTAPFPTAAPAPPPPEKAGPAQPAPLPVVRQVKSESAAHSAVPIVTPAGTPPLGPLAPAFAPPVPELVWTSVSSSGPRKPTVTEGPATPGHLPMVTVESSAADPLRPPIARPDLPE